MKAKTDWKTIAQPWILGCLFPLSWRSKRKIIFKKRLSAEISLIPEDGLFCPNQQPRAFKLNPWRGQASGKVPLLSPLALAPLLTWVYPSLLLRAREEARFGGFAAPWKFSSILSDAEK